MKIIISAVSCTWWVVAITLYSVGFLTPSKAMTLLLLGLVLFDSIGNLLKSLLEFLQK